MKVSLDHISILVKQIPLQALRKTGWFLAELERFESEGTEEIYIGPPESQALLLWQATIGEGPYLKALNKRGPGLHHIAIAVTDFTAYHQLLSELGWLLHPNSLNDYKVGKTVYYVRPGVHTILEVIPQSELLMGERFVAGLEIPTEKGLEHLITGLKLPGLTPVAPGGFRLRIADKVWTLQDFIIQDAEC